MAYYLSSKASDELLEQVSWKKQVARAKKLLEATRQAPAPSKDYVHLLLTERGVVLRRFPITMRGVAQGAVPAPTEKIVNLEEFLVDADFQGEVERTFGSELLKQAKRSACGNWDVFLALGDELLIEIICLLDLQSVASLARVNQRLRELCNSPRLWERLYAAHQGRPSGEITSLARQLGWKNVFFMNKLQLQKELSRRRKAAPFVPATSGNLSPDSTFLTES